jgi:hypothetical protein
MQSVAVRLLLVGILIGQRLIHPAIKPTKAPHESDFLT